MMLPVREGELCALEYLEEEAEVWQPPADAYLLPVLLTTAYACPMPVLMTCLRDLTPVLICGCGTTTTRRPRAP
eukprot:3468408-Rhodomonas_salina.3